MMSLRRIAPCALVLFLAACAGPGDGMREKLASASPADDGTLRLADATRRSGDLPTAASLYEQVLKRHPDNEAARMGMAETALAAGELERARIAFNDAHQRNPKDVNPVLGLARISVMKRELDQAESLYTQAQGLAASTDVRAMLGLGVTRDMQGRHHEAQDLYRKALEIQPENSDVRNNYGLSLALSGEPRLAVNVLLEIATTPSAPQARQNLALAYGLLGNKDAAETVLASDLQRTAVQNNLNFYDYLRSHGLNQPSPEPALAPEAAQRQSTVTATKLDAPKPATTVTATPEQDAAPDKSPTP